LPAVFSSEDDAASFIKSRVDRASTVHADESPAWNALHARFDTRRINHSVEYATDEACTNQAESYFSRLRQGEMGHHHRISGVYLVRYAREASWKEDHRRDSNGLQRPRAGHPQRSVGRFLRLLATQPPGRLITRAPAI
jgi:hypothetical protein